MRAAIGEVHFIGMNSLDATGENYDVRGKCRVPIRIGIALVDAAEMWFYDDPYGVRRSDSSSCCSGCWRKLRIA
jgi:hypothetical protein